MDVMISYVLNDEGITFFIDGIIVFDCPLERIQYDPKDAITAMMIMENVLKKKMENLKGGEIN